LICGSRKSPAVSGDLARRMARNTPTARSAMDRLHRCLATKKTPPLQEDERVLKQFRALGGGGAKRMKKPPAPRGVESLDVLHREACSVRSGDPGVTERSWPGLPGQYRPPERWKCWIQPERSSRRPAPSHQRRRRSHGGAFGRRAVHWLRRSVGRGCHRRASLMVAPPSVAGPELAEKTR